MTMKKTDNNQVVEVEMRAGINSRTEEKGSF